MKNKDHTAPSPGSVEPPPEHSFEELLVILMRGKWVIIATFLTVLSAAAFYTFLSKPLYESTSLVLVDAKGKDGRLPFLDISGTGTTTKITNELETLKARSTTEAVAQALLTLTYIDSLKKCFIPIIRAEVDGEAVDLKDSVILVADRLEKAVEFTPVKESDIIRIAVRSHDPAEAALVANTYTRIYTDRNMLASRVKSRAIRQFLQSQMELKHESLDSTEHALQTYMRTSGVVSLDDETKKVVEQLSALEASRDGIEVDIKSGLKTLTSYRQELAIQGPNVARAIGESSDTYIKLLQEQLAKLEVQRDVVIAQNPDLSREKIYSEKLNEIDAQIASLKKNLADRTETFLGTLVPAGPVNNREQGTANFLAQVKAKIIEQQIEIDGLEARKAALNAVLSEYERQFNEIPRKSIELAKLQRARLSSEKLYLLVEEKFNEAAITETSEFGYVNIIDPAMVPRLPVNPKILLNLVLGAVLGLFLGLSLVVVRSRMDGRIQSPEDLKRYGVTPLATIGVIEIEKPRNGKEGAEQSTEAPTLDQRLVAHYGPLSSMSEGYRHLCATMERSVPDRPTRTILVTSPGPQEGKSTTSANLAITYAQWGSRVLLVDTDMRRPMAQTLFGLPREPGLTEILSAKRLFDNVVHRKVVESLDVLCCGTTPPNPTAILKSQRMRDFVDHVRQSYDIVLFDSPPVLAVTDAAIVSRLVDTVLIVVSAARTALSSLDRAGEILKTVGGCAAGVVLNNFDMRRAYGGSFGKYQRQLYSNSYGYTSNGKGIKKNLGSRG
jgi:capsular exopolysaccharide synthesis family protein